MSALLNTAQGFGWISIGLHWGMALLIYALYGLGLWMVDLAYTDPWYRTAPGLHYGLGMLLGLSWLVRLIWRWCNPLPAIPGRRWEQVAALWVHRAFYVLIAIVVITGYLTTTADGQPVDVFGLFTVPASPLQFDRQEDVAGWIHTQAAHALIALSLLHAAAALKHHFIDRDTTLLRMLVPATPIIDPEPTSKEE